MAIRPQSVVDVMQQSEFDQVERVFERAMELPESQREGFLAHFEEGQPRIGAAVRRLLRGAAAWGEGEVRALRASAAAQGTNDVHIEGCRVLGVIGEGGFGVVYLVEQDAPVRRFVAVKVIKPGMDCAAVLARFDAERQVMAMMDHPVLTAVLGAGLTKDGRPYVIMPFVPGVPITLFCEENALDLKERLELMAEVCEGVAHAHARGIVHRDLKPGNILVSVVDSVARPRVIDFGLAKALEEPFSAERNTSMDVRMVGTPEYMSPEQAGGGPVDERSDQYALGAVLYELIAGRTPHTPYQLRSGGLENLRKVLAETSPRAPSAHSPHWLPRELDWIVLRALEKDPARRYASVGELEADLWRVLRGERVRAGPPARLYRAWRWGVRHRVGSKVGVVLACSAISAGAVSVAHGMKDRQASRQHGEVATIVRSTITGIDRELRMMMLTQAEASYAGGDWTPETEVEFVAALADASRDNDLAWKSEPFARRAAAIASRLWDRTDPRRIEAEGRWLGCAGLMSPFGQGLLELGPDAGDVAERAEKYLPRNSRTYIEVQLGCCWPSKWRDEAACIRRLDGLKSQSEVSFGTTDRLTLRIMRQLATVCGDRHEMAIRVLEDARSRALAAFGPQDPDVHAGLAAEAIHTGGLYGPAAMVDLIRARMEGARRALGPQSQAVMGANYLLADGLLQLGRPQEADAYAAESVSFARRQHGVGTAWVDWTLSTHMAIRLALDDVTAASELEQELQARHSLRQQNTADNGQAYPADTAARIAREFERLGLPERAAPYLAKPRAACPEALGGRAGSKVWRGME